MTSEGKQFSPLSSASSANASNTRRWAVFRPRQAQAQSRVVRLISGRPVRQLLANYETPPGLRDLASDFPLVSSLQIIDDEWRALASLDLPDEATKDGYVNLLFTIRSISKR